MTAHSTLCYEGKLSFYCYFLTCSFILFLTITPIYFEFLPNNVVGAILWGPIFYYVLINMILRFTLRGNDYQIAIRATFLGFAFAASILIAIYGTAKWKPLGIYGAYIAFFHYSEFLAIAWSNPKSLSLSSFMLYHSPQYVTACLFSWIEYFVEVYYFPSLKEFQSLWILGIVVCTVGEILRKLAMFTTKTNFNHLVVFSKAQDHTLITHGIYSIMRHPSYFGWFWWCIGTQIILANPISLIGYTISSWIFFNQRIYIEELTLLNFFGKEYYDYQLRVPIRIPFIKGYQLPKDIVEFLK